MKVKVKDLAYMVLFIPYFLPWVTQWNLTDSNVAAVIEIVNTIGDIWRLVSGVLIIFLYLNGSKRYYPRFIIAVAIYSSLLVLTTALKSGSIPGTLVRLFNRVTICMLFSVIVYENRFGAICAYFKTLILINLVWMIFQPEGLGRISDGNIIYFIGHKNLFLSLFVLFLTLLCMHKGGVHNRTFVFWVLICLVSMFLGGSSTGITVFVAYILLLYFSRKILGYIALHDLAIYITTTVASILLTLFYQFVVNLPMIKWLIESVLGKEITLSTRTILWTESWVRIATSPLFGVGQGVLGQSGIAGLMDTSHNGMLTIIYKSGFLGLAGFIALCVVATSSKDKSRKMSNFYMWLCLGILVMLLDGFMEPAIVTGHPLFLMMLLQYAANRGAFSQERAICQDGSGRQTVGWQAT